jgi:hypothetical protein
MIEQKYLENMGFPKVHWWYWIPGRRGSEMLKKVQSAS